LFYIGFLMTSLLVIYAITQMNLSGLPQTISSMKTQWILAVLSGQFAHCFVRALRICKILDPIKRVFVWNIFSVNSIGFLAVVLLPANTGAIVRTYLLSKKERLDMSTAMGTIVVEKMFDAVSTVGLLLFVVFFALPKNIDSETWNVLHAVGVSVVMLVFVAFVGLSFFMLKNNLLKNILVKATARFSSATSKKIDSLFESFSLGLSIIRNTKQVAIVTAYSLLVWALTILYYYFILKMWGAPVSLEIASMVTLMVMFSAAIPSSPGLVGTFHAAVIFALTTYGISQKNALGIAVMHHLVVFSLIVVWGLYYLWKEKMTFLEIKNI
jgi:glycosyltransferase 2 family protein